MSFNRLSCVSFLLTIAFSYPCLAKQSIPLEKVENERPAITITDDDFQQLVLLRAMGLAGVHKNIDTTPMVPAGDNAVLNWVNLPETERARLIKVEEEMFRQGKITMIVMAGGEATRFGGPKTFVTVSPELGEFLEIKAANLKWVNKTYQTTIPLYILSSEKRLEEFKRALAERKYYGLSPEVMKWYVQGTVDTFIPSEDELRATFEDHELNRQLHYAKALLQANPDGIYRFKGERRKIPAGHFDAIASFIISGLLGDALSRGIEFASIVNIDNLQAILKNDGMIAYFAEKGDDFGFLLAEKNLAFTIKNKFTGEILHPKVVVRFRERLISFDGVHVFIDQGENNGYLYQLNQETKSVDVFDVHSGLKIETEIKIKPETGGTLVQPLSENGEPASCPVLREGFELPSNFDHVNAPFFNTNTIILNLRSLLRLLEVSEEQLIRMTFEELSLLVREKLCSQIKHYFEFKYHLVEGEFPDLGAVNKGTTKITVSQITRILLQAVQLKGAKISYLFAPRETIFAPVKEPEDKELAATLHKDALKNYTLYHR